MSGSKGGRPPAYKPRESLASRASAAEAEPDDHAPTSLDPARLTDDMLAEWSARERTHHLAQRADPPFRRLRAGVLAAAFLTSFAVVSVWLWLRSG